LCRSTGTEPTDTVLMQTEKLGVNNRCKGQSSSQLLQSIMFSGVPRNFFRGGSTNSVEDGGQREWGSGGGSSLVKGSGGSCNLGQEISFHIVKFS
jgi:hypothetical protein